MQDKTFYKDTAKFKGPSHDNGGIPVVAIPSGKHYEVEGKEYLICRSAYESPKVLKFIRKTNKEILDSIYEMSHCAVKDGLVHDGDFIICKATVLDEKKRNIKGTVKEILNIIQAQHGCRVSGDHIMLYGGEIETASNYDRLPLAKKLIKTESLRDVWLKTGWIYNPNDKKWRFEINDSNSAMKISINNLVDNYFSNKYIYNLSDVLSHDNFYYHYISAKDIIFGIANRPNQSSIVLGESFPHHFDKDKFVILLTINIPKYEIIRTNNDGIQRILEQSKRIIIHELQHFLQRRHQFAEAIGIEEIERRLQRDATRIRASILRANDIKSQDARLKKVDKLEYELSDRAYAIYKSQPAELEASDVYDRTYFSKSDRKQIAPYPISDTLVTGGELPQAKSLDKNKKFQRPEVSEEEIHLRWRKKRERIQNLANNIHKLKLNVTRTLNDYIS